ncbi:MAG TPA: RNA polymerase factor sigma-54 [Gammaproteobacteria bacterium]|nr:RNA polymerase factor sigma-54 [Gammaproteobacteria bacterium]
MKAGLALRHSQRLSLTPELRQALGLLQLSAVELATKVQEALEGNVLLERGDEDDAPVTTALPGDTEPPPHPERTQEAEADWDGTASLGGNGWQEEDGERPEHSDRSGQSLKEYLLWQLELARLSARDAAMGAAIIDSLNDDGYLTESLEDIRQSLADSDAAPEMDELEAVLHRVQAFDPVGVAARDLRECLLLQLRQGDDSDPELLLAMRLVQGHLEALAARDFVPLSRTLGVSRERLDTALALIQELHPRPGTTIAGGPVDYVVPDVLVSRRNGTWFVELNSEAVPRVRVNARYAAALRRGENGGDLARQLQEARWLVRSIRMRNDTLLRVARSLVTRQGGFLERGEEAMLPLLMKDLAAELDLHESTVSRVVANKYMATPRGTLAFRHLFSAELPAGDGAAFSATAIRAMIRKLVAQEDPQAPLSDNHITQELVNRGIRVARRTVAKYREAMTIPPAHERRRPDTR